MFQKLLMVFKAIGWLLKGLWYLLVIATPLLGFWLASSLAAYLNGPVWVAALVGVSAFPVLPLIWEFVAHHRHKKKVEALRAEGEEPRGHILTLADRVVLRTLAINLAFLSVLGGLFPQDSFTALSTRGDWMLGERDAAWADGTRDVLFEAAGGLEWLYNTTRDNPYEEWAEEDDEPVPAPKAGEVERADNDADATDEVEQDADRDADADESDQTPKQVDRATEQPEDDTPDDEPTRGDGPPQWPMRAKLHPAVAQMPASQETSPEAVARYVAARERDPYLRVKALYDYVADRIAYDAPALAAGNYPPQDPETVFETRKAVCAGYAKLLERMAETIGINMVYVVGVSRDIGGNIGGSGHAWNAVEIGGRWYLIDATWGAGYVKGDTFTKRYTTAYLFTPPRVMGVDHFPDDPKWQLRDDPLTRGEFMRQPVLRADFFERGFELLDPRRSQISVDDEARVTLQRPRGQHVLASLVPRDGGPETRCDVNGAAKTFVHCAVHDPGSYELRLFASDTRSGTYDFIGQIAVNSR